MIATVLPYWLEVIRALGAGIGPVLLFLTAAIASIVAWKTYRQRKAADELTYQQRKDADDMAYRQRKEADERAEWWRRTQWAIDYATDERQEKANIGVDALDLLSTSPLATTEDRELLDSLFAGVVAARTRAAYTGTSASDAPTTRPGGDSAGPAEGE